MSLKEKYIKALATVVVNAFSVSLVKRVAFVDGETRLLNAVLLITKKSQERIAVDLAPNELMKLKVELRAQGKIDKWYDQSWQTIVRKT